MVVITTHRSISLTTGQLWPIQQSSIGLRELSVIAFYSTMRMKAADSMKRWGFVAVVLAAIIAACLLRRKPAAQILSPETPASATIQPSIQQSDSPNRFNELGDKLTDAQDPVFLKQILPKTREFFATLERLGVNPLQGELQPSSCSRIRIVSIPNGIICPFVIGDGWTTEYTQNPSFSGITYFGQRGPDNPIRAISHADTNALYRLSQGAVTMPEAEVWKIANVVADTFGIDPSKFEKPRMYEEALFEYHLGIYAVEYRKKGSDPLNGLNYTRGFRLKATSPTTAVMVSYSHLEATR